MRKSFLNNFFSSVGAQTLIVVFNFISVPFLLTIIGLEGYGLIAFYSTLQAVFSVLDAGFSPLVIRETASNVNGKEKEKRNYAALLDVVKMFFLITGLLGSTIIFLSSDVIIEYWLNLEGFDYNKIIQLMGIIICLRWWSGFYRSKFVGHQNILVLNAISIFVGFHRFIVVILYLNFFDSTLLGFFKFQFICGVIELALLHFIDLKINIYSRYKTSYIEKLNSFKSRYSFAIHAGLSSILWLVLVQGDKIVILKVLSLENFAIFSLGVLGASIFFFLTSPLSSVMIPKLTEINKFKETKDLKDFYNLTLNLVALIIIPISIYVFMFSEELLYFWVGDKNISTQGSFILGFYALGNALAVLSSFAYFLQSAKGELKLHFIGSLIFVLIFIPTLLFSVINFGMNAAAIVWLSCNILMFIGWGVYIHSIYMKVFFLNWLLKVFAPIVLISFIAIFFEYLLYEYLSRYTPLILFSIFICFINVISLYIIFYGCNFKVIKKLSLS